MVGRPEKVALRNIWAKEAADFTTWLSNNIDILAEQLGIELLNLEKEKPVGTFAVDLVGIGKDGQLAIIENQLGKTDHDHLGKVLTYLSNLNAKTAIWISPDPRPEHVAAINYLNEVVPEDTNFYLIKIEAFKIGNSEPAPFFTLVAGPSPEVRRRGDIKKELAEREQKLVEFFKQLLDKSNKKIHLFKNVSPSKYNSIGTGAGRSGLFWVYVVRGSDARAELFFQAAEATINSKRFKTLLDKKAQIENQFGEPLEWDYKENRKQQYIRSWSTIGGLSNEDKWKEIQDDLVNRMIKLENALKEYLPSLS
jgi:hypothetical protein